MLKSLMSGMRVRVRESRQLDESEGGGGIRVGDVAVEVQ